MLLVSALVLVYRLYLFPMVLSPYRHVPGPYWHRVSKIPFWYYMWLYQLVGKTHALHQQYGNVVLLLPEQVSCNGDLVFLRDIYTKNMPKLSYYSNYTNHGQRNIFTLLDTKSHILLKKMVSGLYAKLAVAGQRNQTFLSEKIGQVVQQVQQHQPVNVLSLFAALAMDAVTAFELGQKNACNLVPVLQEYNITDTFRHRTDMNFWTTQFPLLWLWAAGSFRKEAAGAEKWQLELYANAEKDQLLLEGSTLAAFKKNGIDGKKAYLSLSDHIVAGHETTATTMTYICYQLLRKTNSAVAAQLHDELVGAFGPPEDRVLTDYDAIDRLPFLAAVVDETLRLHLAIPGAEPRLTDKPYMVLAGGNKVELPAGTEVLCQPFLMHRNPDIFSEPDCWVPSRWLGEPEKVREMRRYMIPFGRGIRMCLGMNLAMAEIKLGVANLYWRFHSEIDPAWCSEAGPMEFGVARNRPENGPAAENLDAIKMAMTDAYTVHPVADECYLRFLVA